MNLLNLPGKRGASNSFDRFGAGESTTATQTKRYFDHWSLIVLNYWVDIVIKCCHTQFIFANLPRLSASVPSALTSSEIVHFKKREKAAGDRYAPHLPFIWILSFFI